QIAASYGNIICVFEPVEVSPQGKAQNQKLSYHWQKSGQFVLQSVAHILTWHPTGSCLLTGSACLQLWCDAQSSAETEPAAPQRSWRCVWQCKSAASTHFIKFSPDGEFFATAGQQKPSWREEVRCLSQLSYSGPLPQQQNKHNAHRTNILHANALCHFHIAASINPATDIPLLPSISSMNGSDEEEPGGPFTVHWLNNKELHLTLSMEVFLQQLRGSGEQNGPTERYDADEEGSGADAAALVDHQVDVLLGDWNRAADMLFSIHPMDGSLLVWHVDWLDEYQPGMFRQAQVQTQVLGEFVLQT
ncbi:hypothetical protein cypCar_00038336, partial [Cyprinus carpio]